MYPIDFTVFSKIGTYKKDDSKQDRINRVHFSQSQTKKQLNHGDLYKKEFGVARKKNSPPPPK